MYECEVIILLLLVWLEELGDIVRSVGSGDVEVMPHYSLIVLF